MTAELAAAVGAVLALPPDARGAVAHGPVRQRLVRALKSARSGQATADEGALLRECRDWMAAHWIRRDAAGDDLLRRIVAATTDEET